MAIFSKRADIEQWVLSQGLAGKFECMFTFASSREELEAITGIEAEETEEAGLSETLEWYGQIDAIPFRFQLHSDGTVQCYLNPDSLDAAGLRSWQCIKLLTRIPGHLISKINWIRCLDEGDTSVFLKTAHLVVGLMESTSDATAASLVDYLRAQDSRLFVFKALSENFFSEWICCSNNPKSEYAPVEFSRRDQAQDYLTFAKTQCSNESFFIGPKTPKKSEHPKWRLMRQDDNNNRFEIKRFDYHVDAECAALEYERKSHHQIYWVDSISER